MADRWLDAARAGIVRNRSGDPYKPAAIRGDQKNLRSRVLPVLGHERLREITLPRVQRFVDPACQRWAGPATITAAITPLRSVYRRALQLGDVQHNPTPGLSLPSVNRRQSRFATAEQVEAMLGRLDAAEDRALWATALYAGLRRGELAALRREDVDLATGVIRVERGWDDCEGEVAPKSRQGRRKVPIPAVLRDRLAEYLIDGPASGRIFVGVRGSYGRGRTAAASAGVEQPTLHECRHGYASLMIAAGVNVKALSTFMGHANIGITLDQYGHLLPGAEDEVAGMLDGFLAARQVGGDPAERALGDPYRNRAIKVLEEDKMTERIVMYRFDAEVPADLADGEVVPVVRGDGPREGDLMGMATITRTGDGLQINVNPIEGGGAMTDRSPTAAQTAAHPAEARL